MFPRFIFHKFVFKKIDIRCDICLSIPIKFFLHNTTSKHRQIFQYEKISKIRIYSYIITKICIFMDKIYSITIKESNITHSIKIRHYCSWQENQMIISSHLERGGGVSISKWYWKINLGAISNRCITTIFLPFSMQTADLT